MPVVEVSSTNACAIDAIEPEEAIRYAARSYGETQISRFRHGVMLLRMVVFAFFRIKAQ